MSDAPDALSSERACMTYWYWADPPVVGMPVILEVRVWESGDHRVETPHNAYFHWESASGGMPDGVAAELFIVTAEQFMRLKAAGELTEIGQRETEVGGNNIDVAS
jgi:hypothetical protein